jgi:hypothetical protein
MNDRTHRCNPSIVRSAALRRKVFAGWNIKLDRVKVRRIVRQVSEACANAPDRLLHTGNLVEGYVVGHHNVSTLERRH